MFYTKRMKVIVFLTEPSYTIDLVKMVYLPNGINFKFLYASSYSKPKNSEQFDDNLFLDKLSIFLALKHLRKITMKMILYCLVVILQFHFFYYGLFIFFLNLKNLYLLFLTLL